MTKNNPVIWSEGLFLQAQHFQQQERFLTHEVKSRARDLHAFSHGFVELVLDLELLKVGQLSIARALGYFPDGTLFSIPDKDAAPPPLNLLNHPEPNAVYLTLRAEASRGAVVSWEPHSGARLHAVSMALEDVTQEERPVENVEVAELNLALTVNNEAAQGCMRLRVCTLESMQMHTVQINDQSVPPLLCVQGNAWIRNRMGAVHHLLGNKAEQLMQRKLRKGSHSTSEIGDFLLLQACNKHRILQAHLLSLPRLHPETLYRQWLSCLGDVAVHGQTVALEFQPDYQHEQLGLCFSMLHDALRNALSGLHDQHAMQIPLHAKAGGVYLAQIPDRSLIASAHFVLTVHAQAPDELIQSRFPNTVKIGPAERLRDLVNLNLPGVRLKPMAQKPPAMPFYADHIYFQLETRDDKLWGQLQDTGNLAMHFAGELPELRLELWAIRDEQDTQP